MKLPRSGAVAGTATVPAVPRREEPRIHKPAGRGATGARMVMPFEKVVEVQVIAAAASVFFERFLQTLQVVQERLPQPRQRRMVGVGRRVDGAGLGRTRQKGGGRAGRAPGAPTSMEAAAEALPSLEQIQPPSWARKRLRRPPRCVAEVARGVETRRGLLRVWHTARLQAPRAPQTPRMVVRRGGAVEEKGSGGEKPEKDG